MPPTPVRFSFVYRPGRWRLIAGYGWVLFMAVTAEFWLGNTGIGLTLILATRWLRRLRAARGVPELVALSAEALKQSWLLPSVMCIELHDGTRLWLLREEMQPSTWSALRRFVRLYLPRQALGLSISR